MNKKEYFKNILDTNISPVEYMNELENNPDGYFTLDVRITPPNEKLDRIKGSVHIPLNELCDRINELPTDKMIVICCWDTWCTMGAHAAVMLLDAGLDVKELSGGIAAWNTMKFPIEL